MHTSLKTMTFQLHERPLNLLEPFHYICIIYFFFPDLTSFLFLSPHGSLPNHVECFFKVVVLRYSERVSLGIDGTGARFLEAKTLLAWPNFGLYQKYSQMTILVRRASHDETCNQILPPELSCT